MGYNMTYILALFSLWNSNEQQSAKPRDVFCSRRKKNKKSYSHNSIIIHLNFHKGKVPNLETLKQTSFLKNRL